MASWVWYGAVDENVILTVAVAAFVSALLLPYPVLAGIITGALAIIVCRYLDLYIWMPTKRMAAREMITEFPLALFLWIGPLLLLSWLASRARRLMS
jgi:hypothetical protein